MFRMELPGGDLPVVFFKEKLTVKVVSGLVLAFIGLLILNLT